MKTAVVLVAIVAGICAVQGKSVVEPVEVKAIVMLVPNGDSGVNGTLHLEQMAPNGPVIITGTVTNLKAGTHGFHVHEKGDLTGGCMSAAAHFNPTKVNHGAPEDAVRHVGDLGNIISDETNTAIINITDNIISLVGPHSIIGRSFVVHEGADDLGRGKEADSLTTGHAGGRVACGVVGIL